MNTDAKILNKMLTNWIQEYTEKITHYNQMGFILERQHCYNIHKSINGIHHINKLKDRNHINYLNWCLKHIGQVRQVFVMKALETVGTGGKHLKIIKVIYQHVIIANIILNGDILRISSKIRNEIRKVAHSPLPIFYSVKVLAVTIRQET